MSGWIKLHRKISDNALWKNEPFSRGQAWVDLLLIANHADGFIRVSGERIEIKRGQCGWSLLRLSERWKWSRGKVSRFINELEKDGNLTQKTDNRTTILTICNYSSFQSDGTTDDTPDDTTDGHLMIQQTDTNKKNIRRNKNDKNIPIPENVSENVWNDFLSHRKAKKATVTETALKGIKKEADKAGWSLEEALSEIITRNWQGFKAEWVNKGGRNETNRNSNGSGIGKSERAKAAILKGLGISDTKE